LSTHERHLHKEKVVGIISFRTFVKKMCVPAGALSSSSFQLKMVGAVCIYLCVLLQVTVEVPDVKGRTDILKVHASNKKFADDVSLEIVAMRTPGFSGADLANLLNEAAILTGRRGKSAITAKEIDDSIDRIVAGMEGTVMTDGKSKSLVAYHEVGHAICGTLTPGHDAVQKVTLIPRGQARGLTWFIPGEDPSLISKQQIFARIVGALGGRATEEVVFGDAEVTTGAASDLQQVTSMAKQVSVPQRLMTVSLASKLKE
jgi:cell division protease FtsH